ncbi:NAD-dependent epimerase/dehydratase family protein [Ilumatobacter sp.]|uniref:NAD-dependent epimerase/dehydratase family protein n=1 Tax=Ilumatobacter sp. TaxID=1967498 RepID=UPI003C3720CF
MKIFVTGATGVLGRRAVAQLLAAGAEVTGVARTRARAEALQTVGATPVEVSLFDRDALSAAIAGHRVVCNLATAVPTGEQAAGQDPWENNHRIRREGARNLVDAALHAGAERYVQESIALLYADGGNAFLDESSAVEPTAITEPALTAESEAARFTQHGGVGIALRFGTFYGFDSAHTIETIEAARQGVFAIPGRADAYWPSVTTDDAASAVVAALRAPHGLYNIAEDHPLTRIEHAQALAAALGIDTLEMPLIDADLPADLSMMVRSQRVTSQLFEALTGWQTRFPSARQGWPFVLSRP